MSGVHVFACGGLVGEAGVEAGSEAHGPGEGDGVEGDVVVG